MMTVFTYSRGGTAIEIIALCGQSREVNHNLPNFPQNDDTPSLSIKRFMWRWEKWYTVERLVAI
jgi:hypothetical protein